MKQLTLTLLFAFLTINFTSCVPSKSALSSPSPKIKQMENVHDKNANFIKANEWMVEAFNNAESVIQFTDKDAGIVKGKYIMKDAVQSTSAYVTSTPEFSAIITIRVKDNACRIEIDPPSGMYSQKSMGVEYGFTPDMFNTSADVLISDFETNMVAKSANKNW